MNRILFKEQADSIVMDPRDQRFDHIRGVLRMRKGDSFDVGVVNGPAGKATITSLEKDVMRVDVNWGEVPPLPPQVSLVVGMCRPATARKVLTTTPTLGVSKIIFVEAGRSDSAYAKSSLWKSNEWESLLIKGAEQAFDTHIPELHICKGMEELGESLPVSSQKLALDVYEGTQSLGSIDLNPALPVCLAVGPERGWNANDRKALINQGFELVSLNDRVLRVETAVTVGLTLVLKGIGIY